LIHAARPDNWEEFAKVAKENGCSLAVKAPDLETLAELTGKIKAAGVEDMVLDLTADRLSATLQTLTIARRLALKKGARDLGYPSMAFATGGDVFEEVAQAAIYVAKYAGIVVTSLTKAEQVLPLLTVRQNVFTDPRKPIQVEPMVYEIGAANSKSPVLITTNFSLTYYTVESDVEASRVPSYILVVDTEGTSVLTAYSGDKLNEKTVADAMAKFDVEKLVKHRKLIIPGYVAVMSGKLEEATNWEIMVGPRECSMLPKYLQELWN